MPIKIKFLDDGMGVTIIGWGILKDDEYIKGLTDHLTHDEEKYKEYRYCLSDFTAVTDVQVYNESIGLIAELCNKTETVNPNVLIATVADSDLTYGLSRMSQTMRNETSWESMVFRNRKDAEIWIREKVKEKYGIVNLTFH